MLKHLILTEPASASYLDLTHHIFHPLEDAWSRSKDYPIFVVADGVTLEQLLIEGKSYPNPSPAGEAARIFCDSAALAAEANYEASGIEVVKRAFEAGNRAVGEYNRSLGRTKETVDYWLNDLYAATAALVVFKGDKVYWGSMCDSFVMHFDRQGRKQFESPACHSLAEAAPAEFRGDPNDRKAGQQYIWRVRRNGLNDKGQRTGYGVVTGEAAAMAYLSTGSFPVGKGDLVAVLTDGFQEYMELTDFVAMLRDMSGGLEARVKSFTAQKAEEDPEGFGHERTLIAVSI